MGKHAKGNKRKYLIIEIFLVLLICGSLFIYFDLDSLCKVKEKEYKSLLKKYEKIKEEKNKKENDYKKISDEVADYNNIDKKLSSTKDEYFKLAKELEDAVKDGKTDKRIAYLTFDDGPYYNTYKVLDILDENNVKATFFTITASGQNCYDNKSEDCFKLYKEYYKRGHTIANHTYTHNIFTGLYNSNDTFMDSVIRQEEHIKNQIGFTTNIVRFPGGVASAKAKGLNDSVFDRLRERGYGWIDWTAVDGDGGDLSSKNEAWNIFVKAINENIEVVLLHDYNAYTTELLPDMIKYLRENNFVLLPLFYESSMVEK